jgi:hypothetical protein
MGAPEVWSRSVWGGQYPTDVLPLYVFGGRGCGQAGGLVADGPDVLGVVKCRVDEFNSTQTVHCTECFWFGALRTHERIYLLLGFQNT